MKKSLIIVFILVFTPLCFAQKCKYERNEVDQSTKQLIKVTKTKLVYDGFFSAAEIAFSNFSGKYSLEYCHGFVAGCATTYEGCEITFLLASGKSITVTKGKMDYSISQKEIQSMLESKVIKIRYQYGDNPGNAKFIEYDIKNKHSEDIIELIKCVL